MKRLDRPTDFQEVPEILRCQHSGFGTVTSQQNIGRQRCTVYEYAY